MGDYIGWARWKHGRRGATLHLCNSDDEGAFKIYRHYDTANGKLRAELSQAQERVSGEHSENCPFCKSIGMTAHSQQSPQCGLCQLESNLAAMTARAETAERRYEQLRNLCKEMSDYLDTTEPIQYKSAFHYDLKNLLSQAKGE